MEAAALDPEYNNRLHGVLERVGDLAVLPHVVFKVLEISAESADTAGVEMEKAIVIDPGFSSKILIRANSAAYGLPRKMVSIREAIAFLGYRAIRNLAMTVGVFDLFIGKNDRNSLRRRGWWRRSLDSAVCARWMARELQAGYPEEAYTCALLHLLGKTLLDKLEEGDFDQVELLMANEFSELDAERRVFGVDHVMLTMGAASRWGLPPDLVAGINYISPAGPTETATKLRALTALSHFVAGVASEGWMGDLNDPLVPQWAMSELGLSEEKFEEIVRNGIAVIAAAGRDG
jgi:HD-like signal output (HDOD) protein